MWESANSATDAARIERPSSPLWDAVRNCLGRVKIRRKPHALHLTETLPLGERRMLALVEWRGETLLIGVTPQHIQLLQAKGNAPGEGSESGQEQKP